MLGIVHVTEAEVPKVTDPVDADPAPVPLVVKAAKPTLAAVTPMAAPRAHPTRSRHFQLGRRLMITGSVLVVLI
jgi:hypothetical protein